MQARLAFNRFPSTLLIVFALVVALLLGGAAGYALKPNPVAPVQQSDRTYSPATPAYEYTTPTLSKSGRSL
jgi:hypothetical protein